MASKTEMFRTQHKDLLGIVGQLRHLLDPTKLAKDGAPARTLLNQLAGKLNVHLAMEDKSLYPQLLKYKDPAVQAKAKTFMDQMGGIKEAFGAYMAKYPSAQVIEKAAAAFVSDSEGLAKVVAKRMQSEDMDLYALVDRLG